MKNIILCAALTGMLCVIFSCNDSKNVNQVVKPYEPIELSASQTQQVSADNSFAFDLLKNVNRSESNGNFFISPLSISQALGMTYNGAAGTTKTAMETALRRNGFSSDEINAYYKKLTDGLLGADPSTQLKIANSIWTRKDFPVLQSFYDVNAAYYGAKAQSLDFGQPSSKDIINNWCSQNTNGKVPHVIDDISNDVMMYLINAVYFKGIWKSQFKTSDTFSGSFAAPTGSVPVKYMKQENTFNYFGNDSVQCAELPYGNGAFSMVVVLPASNYSVDQIVDKMNSSTWKNWLGGMHSIKLHVELPKFKLSYKTLLNNSLSQMGMGIAFSNLADFSKIANGGGLAISRVLHNTFVTVDEEGTEAAAVTVVEMGYTSVGPQIASFIVNRPFLFFIKEKSTGTILFAGKILKPVIE
ncbi:serpin family protein [Paludibacter jiangxiensis]|uniref:Serpin B n=1 Tax=Paludibacter jiangxiensis TaxID=681398 RepID=A0A161LVM4_9BACT|nr:serpin family protein [Paludibacter jiangxiensis]GAT63329.1 serpin B [Paludibacter jiangxiensis]